MNFEERARKTHERGDAIRALVMLIEGLKRHPETPSGLDLLLQLYGEEWQSPGLEPDIVRALIRHPEGAHWMGVLLGRLERRDCSVMAQQLTQVAHDHGVEIAAVFAGGDEAEAEEAEAPEPDPSSDPASAEALEAPGMEEEIGDEPGLPAPLGLVEQDEQNQATEESLDVEAPEDEPTLEQPPEDETVVADKPVVERPVVEKPETSVLTRPIVEPQHRIRRAPQGASMRGKKSMKGRSSMQPRWIKIAAMGTFALLVAGFVGYQAWLHIGHGGAVAQIESRLTAFEPTDLPELESILDEEARPGNKGWVFEEHRWFARAVVHFETGEVIGVPDTPLETPWGQAAAVLGFAQSGDMESALSTAVKLERTYPDALAAIWVRGRLCEHRGTFACAETQYLRAADRFVDFVPAQMGLARLAAKRLDRGAWLGATTRLARVSPEHAYLRLELGVPLRAVLVEGDERAASPSALKAAANPTEMGGADRFAEAISLYNKALAAVQAGAMEEALVAAREAVARDSQLATAWVLLGVLEARVLNIEHARDYFMRAANIDSTSEELRWSVLVLGPLSLTAAGRPDLGLVFATPDDDELVGAAEDPADAVKHLSRSERQRPASLAGNVVPLIADSIHAREALWARAVALRALGAGEHAAATAAAIEGFESHAQRARLERIMARLALGDLRQTRRLIRQAQEGTPRDIAEASLAYLEGRYEDAIATGLKANEAAPGDVRVLRMLILSYIALGRGRDAISLVEKSRVPVLEQPELESLKLRVYSRLQPGAATEEAQALYEALSAVEPTSANRLVDLAATSFWQRRIEDARAWAERALALSEKNPEANWVMGLILRTDGQRQRAQGHFRRAWRGGENDARLLVELGHIQLDYGRFPLAQEIFYQAVLSDRSELDAIQGLALAYLGFDAGRGRRDMARLLDNYGSTPRNTAHRGEILKWLGVLHGSREGAEPARSFLEQASQQLGTRPDLLVELARYHEARSEYDLAREHYATALQKNATLADAHLGLGQMAIKTGDHRLARIHLGRFLTLEPDPAKTETPRAQLDALGPTDEQEAQAP